MKSQAPMVQASLAREHSAYEVSGPRRCHPTEADRLRTQLAAALESRAALMDAYLRLTGREL